ncbi:hypothetical protein [Nocardia sp. NPDC057227]|uniref:hypothetical protein n=1 Tax=Nocardia sp. NPDC057227 TaxID=3346056 RepID=UPI0036373C02
MTATLSSDDILAVLHRTAQFILTLATGQLQCMDMATGIEWAINAPGDFTLTGPHGVILTRTDGELTDPHRTTTLGDQLRWTHVAGDTWKGVRLNDGATYQVGGWDNGWAATATIDGQRERVTEVVGTRTAAQQAAQAHSDANPVERDPWKV